MVKSDVCAANRPAAPSQAAGHAEHRSTLLALRRSGQRYRFLDLGYRYLSAVPTDAEVTLELLKALVELGLGGPARELLHQRSDLADAGLDAAELRKALASIPTGRVPWTSLQDQFDANLAALIDNHPHLHDHRHDIERSVRGFQLFRSTDGRLHLSRHDTGQMRRWLPSLTDHASADAAEPKPQQMRDAILIIGFHLNDFIDRVYADASAGENNQKAPLFLADPAWHRLAAWLYARDRTAILSDPRVYVFAGPDAPGQYERTLLDNDGLNIAPLRLACYMPQQECTPFDEAAQRARAHRTKRYADSLGRLKQCAAQRDDAYWADRLKPGARVIGFTSRFTTMLKYSMRDIGDALEALGYQFQLCMEAADHERNSDSAVAQRMAAFDPDLVVLINHFRYELPEPLGNVPVLTWVQDPMPNILCKKAGASIGPRDFVCGYYGKRLVEEFGYPASNLMAAPIPVSTRMFHEEPVDQADRDRYECDIMYVAHMTHTPDSFHREWIANSPEASRPLINALHDEVVEMRRKNEPFAAVGEELPAVRAKARSMGLHLEDALLEPCARFYYRCYDIHLRVETLEWVARWCDRTNRVFKLYGKGWEHHHGLARFAMGPIEHGEALRKAYRCAKLTLHVMPGGFRHQRSFEALASGSLVLTQYAPNEYDALVIGDEPGGESALRENIRLATAERFPGFDRIVFRSAEEFEHLAEHYLNDDSARNDVLVQFQDVVHSNFTYTAVLNTILKRFRDRLSEAVSSNVRHAGVGEASE